ncbi:MAG: mechanosensitive ion channel [Cardiobacteriaceae bacterium]|nr:mechanosensitive ion channel [Cardiobacteriaceae bacterium]
MRHFLLSSLLLIFCAVAHAQNLDNASALLTLPQLEHMESNTRQSEARNHEWQKSLSNLRDETLPENISESDLAAIRVSLEQTQADLNNLTGEQNSIIQDLDAAKKRGDSLNALLQKQANPLLDSIDNDKPHASRLQTQEQLELNQHLIQILQQQKSVALQGIAIAEQRKSLLEARYQRYNEHYLETRQGNATTSTRDNQLSRLEDNRRQLSSQLNNSNLDRDARLDKYIELALLNTQILYTGSENELLILENRLQELQFADLTSLSLERIDSIRSELGTTLQRIDTIGPQLDSSQRIISEQYLLYERQRNNPPESVKARRKALDEQYQQLKVQLENSTLSLKTNRDIADRQYTQLAKNQLKQQFRFGGELNAVPQLLTATLKAGGTFLGQYAVALQTLGRSLSNLAIGRCLMLAFTGISLILLTLVAVTILNRTIRRYASQKRLTFASRLILFLSKMLKNNLPYLAVFLFSLTIIRATAIPAPASDMLALLPAILLFNTIPYYAARNLIKTELIATPEKQRIIRPTIIYAAIGSLLFAFVLMADWILDDEPIINTYRWIFALYNLLVAIPIWRAVSRSLTYMNGFYQEYSTYRILRPIIRTIPMGVLAFGLIGTLGYLNLAWLIAKHLLIFVLYALIWIAFTAFLKDSALRAKRYALRNTNRGVFWAQDVINPIHNLLTYGSLILFLRLLQYSYEWDEHTPVIQSILTLLRTPITKGDNSHLTLLNILLMAVIIYVIYRIGGWIKSFSYRWVYGKIADLGIRNSLAVFSQYAAVTLGFFLALRVIGIDLTAFTIFAGALGVGIGFGMQTIANNFISGILLLIERPLRNGDIITVGNYEGTVERIGMRSLTITTFNNESVILPNSDFVTSAFMNWSHQDPIMRTVLYLDLNYRHDPHNVQEQFMRALSELAEEGHILDTNDHNYDVFAYNCSERGLTYRLQYHVHMQQHHLMTSRHLVIERIWQTCRANNIEIAYPKYDLYFPENPDQLAHAIRQIPNFRADQSPGLRG